MYFFLYIIIFIFKKDDDDDEEEDSFKNRIEMLKEKKEANALKKREFFAQVKEFKERYNKFMIGKSDLFFLMNLLGNFIEFMNGIKV